MLERKSAWAVCRDFEEVPKGLESSGQPMHLRLSGGAAPLAVGVPALQRERAVQKVGLQEREVAPVLAADRRADSGALRSRPVKAYPAMCVQDGDLFNLRMGCGS